MRFSYPATAYNVTMGAASVTGTRVTPVAVLAVRLLTDTDCYVTIGPSPVATVTTSMRVKSGFPERFTIHGGDQVAVIPVTGSTGSLNVTELTS